jgi:hypothetical protein
MAETIKQVDQQAREKRRQVSRDLVDFEAPLARNGGKALSVRLVDLSPKGYHARCGKSEFERGDVVSLRLPIVGLLPGRVMWGLKGCFGVQFSVPIDAGNYHELIAHIRAETPDDPASAAR